MSRTKAFFIHLLISVILICMFLSFALTIWYQEFFVVSKVVIPIKLLILVDIIIGPVLTFIVYVKGKKTLKLDLVVIVIIQLLAFLFGGITIFYGKPSLVVFNGNSFEIVHEVEMIPEGRLSRFFSGPAITYIPNQYTSNNSSASELQNDVEVIEKENWAWISGQQIEIARVSVLAKIDESTIKSELAHLGLMLDDVMFFDLVKDGLISVIAFSKHDYKPVMIFTQFRN